MSEQKSEKRVLVLQPQNMGLAEAKRQDWVADAEDGTLIEDVLNPAYWSHLAPRMKPYDRVEVRVESGEWMLDLLVTDVERNWARVVLLQKHDLVPIGDGDVAESAFEAKFRSHHKWCVIRLSDREVLSKNHDSKVAAEEWIRQYEKTILTP